MSVERPIDNTVTDLPIITGKEFQRATYTALALFAVMGLAATIFQNALDQLLGGLLDVVILAVTALILIVIHIKLMRIASRRVDFRTQVALMIESHQRLDEAIAVQLKEVVTDTGNAVMMLIMEVQDLSNAAKVIESVLSPSGNNEDERQHYMSLFSAVTEYNTHLEAGIIEILGHVQFHDVVRQRTERIEKAIAKRNALFQAFARGMDTPDSDLLELSMQMREVVDEYLSIESRHASSANDTSKQDDVYWNYGIYRK